MRLTIGIVLLLIGAANALAQESDQNSPEPDSARIDTILFIPPQDTLLMVPVTDTVNLESRLTQKPTLALFKSMALPGWGQLGNRRYTKALIFAGLETWFIGSAIHYGRQASDRRDEWNNLDESDVTARDIAYRLYLDRRDERNKFTWFAGLTVFISMFDAYVDAHLSGAPTDPRQKKLGIHVGPAGDGLQLRLAAAF